jgi:hypothetical protein
LAEVGEYFGESRVTEAGANQMAQPKKNKQTIKVRRRAGAAHLNFISPLDSRIIDHMEI